MKIAIDGPSASGKGTISKILAVRLNAVYLNTGKIYRIIAFLASKLPGNLEKNAIFIAKDIKKHFIEQAENNEIYTEENAKVTSEIAKILEVRNLLIDFQREFAEKSENVILEGRDIGTAILPNADFKFYLDASLEERTRRRTLQLGKSITSMEFKRIFEEIKQRDENDSEREHSALKIAKDAHYIDTTGLDIEAVVNTILNIIK